MRWVIFISLFFLLVSCAPHAGKDMAERPPERTISRDEAVGGLPCFRCHSYVRFSSTEKGAGVFPHSVHRDAGYHCNQCHAFSGHKPMKINTAVCKNCHDLKAFVLASSGFPVRYNHESHSKLGCRECHLGIFLMKKGSTSIVMDDLYQGRYCGECHNGKRAFASTECARCHDVKKLTKDLAYKVEGVGNVIFSHRFHTAMFGCTDCHTKFFNTKKTEGRMTMDEMNSGKFCGGCHNGNTAAPVSDCGKCHKA